MKMFALWVFAIMIISFIGGVIAFGRYEGFTFSRIEYQDEKILPIDGISEVSINVVADKINIYKTTDASIKARYKGYIREDQDSKLETEATGNLLKISIGSTIRPQFFAANWPGTLDIYIPADFEGKIKLHAVSGSIEMTEGVKGITQYEAKTISGRIILSGVSGKVSATTISGGIVLNFLELADTEIASTSGRVEINVPADSAYKYLFNTTSGRFVLNDEIQRNQKPGNKRFDGEVGINGKIIKVTSVSGSLEIK